MIDGRSSKSLRLIAALAAPALIAPVAPAGGGVRISEIRIDQPGTDNDEYFELAGDPGASLDDLTYLVIGDQTAGSGVIEEETSLAGIALDGNGFLVVAEPGFSLGQADVLTVLDFENSDNVTHLLVAGFTGFVGQDLDPDDDGDLDVTPWTAVVDLIALVEEPNPPQNTEYHYGPPAVGPDGQSVPWHAYRCDPDDTWAIGSQGAGVDDTPGATNRVCSPSCGARRAALPQLRSGRAATAQAQAAISIDGVFDDWSAVDVAYADASGDAEPGGVDFGRVWLADDGNFLFVRIELGTEVLFSDDNALSVYLDTDDDPCTGLFVDNIGAELEWEPGLRRGTFHFEDTQRTVFQDDLRFRAAPGFGTEVIEFAFGRDSRPDGVNRLFPGGEIKVIVRDEPAGDQVPDAGDTLSFSFEQGDPPVDAAIPIERERPDDFRFSAFNVRQDGPWDQGQAPRFGRLLAAADPQIVVLSEIYGHTAPQTRVLMQSWIPGRTWRVVENASFRDVKIAAAYPILDTWNLDGNLAALVDTTEALGTTSLVIGAHLPCCSNDEGRQEESDRIMEFVREAREPGGDLHLEDGAPIFIAGDLNLVGSSQPFRTLTTGDILDEGAYGPDFDPDWDGTPLTNVIPRQTELRMGYTWRNDASSFWPGQLDKIIYTDSVIEHGRAFTIYTPEMSPANLSEYGLLDTDSFASDHLLMSADFRGDADDCAADINGSGDVGFADLLQLLSAWGPCEACPEDLDGDDAVEFDDLLLLLAAWGPC